MTVVFILHLIMTLVAKRSAKQRESIEAKPVENDEVFDHLFINKTTKQLIKL